MMDMAHMYRVLKTFKRVDTYIPLANYPRMRSVDKVEQVELLEDSEPLFPNVTRDEGFRAVRIDEIEAAHLPAVGPEREGTVWWDGETSRLVLRAAGVTAMIAATQTIARPLDVCFNPYNWDSWGCDARAITDHKPAYRSQDLTLRFDYDAGNLRWSYVLDDDVLTTGTLGQCDDPRLRARYPAQMVTRVLKEVPARSKVVLRLARDSPLAATWWVGPYHLQYMCAPRVPEEYR